MQGLKAAMVVGGLVVSCVGVAMAATNPNQETYEAFATQKLIGYLDEKLCTKVPAEFSLKAQCKSALQTNQLQIQSLVSKGTDRQNFIFFSVYKTHLSLSLLLPSYQFETVGVFRQFHIYQAKEN